MLLIDLTADQEDPHCPLMSNADIRAMTSLHMRVQWGQHAFSISLLHL